MIFRSQNCSCSRCCGLFWHWWIGRRECSIINKWTVSAM